MLIHYNKGSKYVTLQSHSFIIVIKSQKLTTYTKIMPRSTLKTQFMYKTNYVNMIFYYQFEFKV